MVNEENKGQASTHTHEPIFTNKDDRIGHNFETRQKIGG